MGCNSSQESGQQSNGNEARKVDWSALKDRLPIEATDEAKAKRMELWKQFDVDSSERVTYEEALRATEKTLRLEEFAPTSWRTLFRRAFDRAARRGNMLQKGTSSVIEFLEFRLLLCYLYNYCEVQVLFEQFDREKDNRITRKEFHDATPLLKKFGLDVTNVDDLFNEVDKVKDGVILFDEFAKWAAEAKLDADGDNKNLTVLTV